MSEKTADDQVAEQEVKDQDTAAAPADNVRLMDRAKKQAAAAADRVGEARERFGERFQQASATAQEEFRNRSQWARERYREKSAQMSSQIGDGYVRARKEAEYRLDDVHDFVRHKPGTSILIAAGAGFLLGLLFRPRRYHD